METIILDLLTRSMAEFAQINADLAATSRNLTATAGTADAITGVIATHLALTSEIGRE